MRKARIAQVALRRNMRQELWDDGSKVVNAQNTIITLSRRLAAKF